MIESGLEFTPALKYLIATLVEGSTIFIPPNTKTYDLTEPIVIDRRIRIQGFWMRNKSKNTIHGTVIKVPVGIDQTVWSASITVNATGVEIEGIALRGRGKVNKGSLGMEFLQSNGANIRKVFIDGYDQAYKLGSGSAHVCAYDLVVTDCNDAVVFGKNNLFDFTFINGIFDGNIRSAFFLEKNVSTESVMIFRCHMGWPTQYGILQDPETTTGDGFSVLTVLHSPIEQVKVQPISIVNGGNIKIDGGYWTWYGVEGGSTGTEAFRIKDVNSGPIWFNPKLEPTYSNPNASCVLRITGYTGYPIYLDGNKPNAFAPEWINEPHAGMPGRLMFYRGTPYMGNNTLTTNNTHQVLTTTTKREISSTFVKFKQNMQIVFIVKVYNSNKLKLQLQYAPVGGVTAGVPNTVTSSDGFYQTRDILPETTLTVGEYHYTTYITADYHQPIKAFAQTDTANSCFVSVSMVPID